MPGLPSCMTNAGAMAQRVQPPRPCPAAPKHEIIPFSSSSCPSYQAKTTDCLPLSAPWLWSSSTGCLYLELSHEKRSYSLTAHTAFHSTWTRINSAYLRWYAWLWNSNLLVCVCVCVSNSTQEKAAAWVYNKHTAALSRIPLTSCIPSAATPAEVSSVIWDLGLAAVTLFQTRLGKKQNREEKQDVQF